MRHRPMRRRRLTVPANWWYNAKKVHTMVRVRFAPSPTGYLHIGGARTALFNYLFARRHGGTFILRIEDTDQKRFQPEALAEIYESLKWLGLTWDEGPDVGGPAAPYVQSQRTAIYRQHAEQLLAEGKAYRCFCTPERLAQVREEQEKAKMQQGSGYDRHCRHLPAAETERQYESQQSHVIRFKIPLERTIAFSDIIRGPIQIRGELLDDFVLLKSDGFPTYHLANIVDDHLMGVTHVLRGDEWLTSTPRHILLYEAFGWEPPQFAHLPIILAPGGGKLSKRKGAASVLDYRQAGYLPDALFNFLALIGWNPGNDKEIMSREELCQRFSLEQISPKASVFDEKKLEWMNAEYMKMERHFSEILDIVKKDWEQKGYDKNGNYYENVLKLFIPRAKKITEISESGFSGYFFEDPIEFEKEKSEKYLTKEFLPILQQLVYELNQLSENDFTPNQIELVLKRIAQKKDIKIGEIIHPTRLALSGKSIGPGLFEMMAVLGKDVVLQRLGKIASKLK